MCWRTDAHVLTLFFGVQLLRVQLVPLRAAAGPQAGRGPVESQSGRNTPGPVAAGESPVSSGLVDPDEVEPSPAAAAFI